MDSECNIAGFAIDNKCGEVSIEENKALDFHLWFIDRFGNLLNQSKNPKITVSLFQSSDVTSLGVTIIPVSISDVSQENTRKTFLFRLELVTSDTVTSSAYPKVLALIRICTSIIDALKTKASLTIQTQMSIVNSNKILLTLQIQKTT